MTRLLLYSSKKPYGNKTDEMEKAKAMRYILAKNHMVTKPVDLTNTVPPCYILAKNHMVTKRLMRNISPS